MSRYRSAALLMALGVSACAGTTGTPPSPAPVSSPLPLSIQRYEAQAGIVVTNGIEAASLFAAVLRSLQSPSASTPGAAPCKDGVEKTVVVSPELVKVTLDVFYEPNCVHRFIHAVFNANFVQPTVIRVTGKQTAYTRGGTPVAYGTLKDTTTVNGSSSHSVIRGTLSDAPSGKAPLQFGLTCTFASRNACGFGGVTPVKQLSGSFGVSAALDGFTGNGSSNGTVRLKGYTGPVGGLSIARGPGDTWTVRGGTLVATQAGTFSETTNARTFTVSGNLSLGDQIAGASVTVPVATKTGMTGAHVRRVSHGTIDASFSVDPLGSGSIIYSNASTAKIVLFVITS